MMGFLRWISGGIDSVTGNHPAAPLRNLAGHFRVQPVKGSFCEPLQPSRQLWGICFRGTPVFESFHQEAGFPTTPARPPAPIPATA